jgi:antitoxin component YwqK of YwqJK toxin-antitoxin module
MKKVLLISWFLYCYIGISGQDNPILADGYQIFKYPNGVVSSEGLIKNGKPEGFWKSYYVTGIKKSEGKRTNFQLDSIWLFYDQAGDTTEKINYLGGRKNGYYYKFKKDPGRGVYIWSKELYAGDKKEGTAFLYFPDGKIQQTISYKGNKKEGLSKEYNKDGNIITLLEYNNDFLVSRERINGKDTKGLKQGDWKEFYPSGGLKIEMTYKNDLLNGYYKEYDNRGRLVVTMLYENGAIVKSKVEDEQDIEIVNKYDTDGKLIYSGPYRKQIPVGIHRDYNKDGKVLNGYIYNDNGVKIGEGIIDEAGNKTGKWKEFTQEGDLFAEGQYNDNRRSGAWKFYNSGKKVEQTGSYSNGRPDGLWKWYYENGSILREEDYFQGQRDGQYTEYSPNGEIIAQGVYSDGEKNGEWTTKAGDCIEKGKYIIGLKEGEWKSNFSNGKLMFKGDFVQGNPDGSQYYYYEDGTVKEEQYFRMGIKQKTWKKFNEEGSPVLVITYKDDVETSINGIQIKLPENDTRLIK